MNIEIHEFEKNDLLPLKSLLKELGYSLEARELEHNISLLENSEALVLTAKMNGQLIGCISAKTNTGLFDGKYGEIIALIVSEKFRGRGIGKTLVLKAEKWLQPQVTKIRVRTNTIRIESHSFYKHLGYKEIKTQQLLKKTI